MTRKPGGKDNTFVRGSDGAMYVADKKGKLTKLSDPDRDKIDGYVEQTEEYFTKLIEGGTAFVAGGVNLPLPNVFPGPEPDKNER